MDSIDVGLVQGKRTLKCKRHEDYGIRWFCPDDLEMVVCKQGAFF